MSDIVERLYQGVDPDDIRETEAAMDRGAKTVKLLRAKIERLTAALREIVDAFKDGKCATMAEIARAALDAVLSPPKEGK